MHEQLLFDELETLGRARLRSMADRAAVAIRVRGVIRAGDEGTEAATLRQLARGQRERAHRAAVKRSEKRDDVVTLRLELRELQRRLVGLRAGVREERAVW